jgi:hypothetical protein
MRIQTAVQIVNAAMKIPMHAQSARLAVSFPYDS